MYLDSMTQEQICERCRKWLQEQMDLKGWKPADVVRAAEAKGLTVSKQNISRVLNKTPAKSGALPTFSRETIINLARTFNSSESEALAVIGAMSDDVNSVDLVGKKAADLIVKLPADRQPEALDYLQHMVNRYAGKKAAKRLKGEAGKSRARKASKR